MDKSEMEFEVGLKMARTPLEHVTKISDALRINE